MKTNRFFILWAYLVEILLSALIFTFFELVFNSDTISNFIISCSGYFMTLTGILIAQSVASFHNYCQKQATEFGGFLFVKGAHQIYSKAFSIPIFLYIIIFILLIISGYSRNIILTNITFFLVIYGLVNIYSVINNALGLMKLHNLFRAKLEKNK